MSNYPVTDATKALKAAESVSRKYLRAEHALRSAIRDLEGAGFDADSLKADLDRVIEARNVARVKRELARDLLKEAGIKALEVAGTKYLEEDHDWSYGYGAHLNED